jgi:hypothetical protein
MEMAAEALAVEEVEEEEEEEYVTARWDSRGAALLDRSSERRSRRCPGMAMATKMAM